VSPRSFAELLTIIPPLDGLAWILPGVFTMGSPLGK
jgi:hypothetical protein